MRNEWRRCIGAVYRKELIDVLRDRRTLIAMIVIPVVLYPLVMLGFVRAAESEQTRLQAERFVIEVSDEVTRRQLLEIVTQVQQQKEPAEQKLLNLEFRMGDTPPETWEDHLQAHVSLTITPSAPPLPPRLNAQIVYNEVNVRSRTAMESLNDVFNRYRDMLVRASVGEMIDQREPNHPASFDIDLILKPVNVKTVSTATERQRGGWALGQVIPVILVLMTITGSIYPAIDLTAGERERGTLETLMVTPVPPLHLIMGKFLVVSTVGLMTAALNIASVGATMHFSGLTRAISAEMPVKFPLSVLPVILLCMVPFALLFAAILVAVCSFARTFKEAQNYVMPVIIVSLIPAFAVAMPSVRLEGIMLVMPVGNMVLLTREMFLETHTAGQVVIVLLSTMLYAAAAVAVAAKLFGQEAVLFSDSRPYKTMLLRRFFVPAPLPTVSVALLLAALLFPASFYAQSLIAGTSFEHFLHTMGWLAIVQFAGLFIALPWFIAVYFKIDTIETFKFYTPPARAWIAALCIGASSWALSDGFIRVQECFIPRSKALEEFGRQIESQLETAPLALVVLLMAVVPAIAEELLFRGFLLSGLSNGLRKWPAIATTALIFGIYHFFIDKLPVTALMGVVLGYICWQSRSIFPGMIVHALHNGLFMVLSHSPTVVRWMGMDDADAGGHIHIRILIPAAAFFAAGIAILVSLRGVTARVEPATPAAPPDYH